MQIKNRENPDSSIDIHGRIESIDQSLRSVDHRLRAVEKRLSIKMTQSEAGHLPTDSISYDCSSEIEELRQVVETMNESMEELRKEGKNFLDSGIEIKVTDAFDRITKLENHNKITIGKIKVPIEFSGLLASVVLLVTGYLISIDRWEILRSSYYPIIVGILFGIVVIARFIATNRK